MTRSQLEELLAPRGRHLGPSPVSRLHHGAVVDAVDPLPPKCILCAANISPSPASCRGNPLTCCSSFSCVDALTTTADPEKRNCSRVTGRYQAASVQGLLARSWILLLLWQSWRQGAHERARDSVGGRGARTPLMCIPQTQTTPVVCHKAELAAWQETPEDDSAIGGPS